MSKERATEQKEAEEWVAHVVRGVEILHPLTRRAVLGYLEGQVRALEQEIETDKDVLMK